ncbi:transposase family protein [Glycomyces sp. YM15]|uniref:transposase family protein n=1 Tax=Glycomyces sp. YM15 TaxID=2800446 RepID=UPI0035AC0077
MSGSPISTPRTRPGGCWSWSAWGEQFADAEPVRLPHKKPKGQLTVDQRQYNKALGALRAMAEKANADLKMRFRAAPDRSQSLTDRCHRPRLPRRVPARTRPDRVRFTGSNDHRAQDAPLS